MVCLIIVGVKEPCITKKGDCLHSIESLDKGSLSVERVFERRNESFCSSPKMIVQRAIFQEITA